MQESRRLRRELMQQVHGSEQEPSKTNAEVLDIIRTLGLGPVRNQALNFDLDPTSFDRLVQAEEKARRAYENMLTREYSLYVSIGTAAKADVMPVNNALDDVAVTPVVDAPHDLVVTPVVDAANLVVTPVDDAVVAITSVGFAPSGARATVVTPVPEVWASPDAVAPSDLPGILSTGVRAVPAPAAVSSSTPSAAENHAAVLSTTPSAAVASVASSTAAPCAHRGKVNSLAEITSAASLQALKHAAQFESEETLVNPAMGAAKMVIFCR